jgi:hypothetical protein
MLCLITLEKNVLFFCQQNMLQAIEAYHKNEYRTYPDTHREMHEHTALPTHAG